MFDEKLGDKLRKAIGLEKPVEEKRMFGGLAFLKGGKMFIGIVKDELMVRVGKENHEEALKDKNARTMDFTGKPMLGYVFVSQSRLTPASLKKWVKMGLACVEKLK